MRKFFPAYLVLILHIFFFCLGMARAKENREVICFGRQTLAPQAMYGGGLDYENSLYLLQQYQEQIFIRTGSRDFPLNDENLDRLEKSIFESIKRRVYHIFSTSSNEEEKNRELQELILLWQNPDNDAFLPIRLKKKIALLEKLLFKKSLVEEIMNTLVQMDAENSSLTIMAPGFRMTSLNKVSYAYADIVRDYMGKFLGAFPGIEILLSHNKWIAFGLNEEWLKPRDFLDHQSELEYLYVYGFEESMKKHEEKNIPFPGELLQQVLSKESLFRGNLKERLILEIESKKDAPEAEKSLWREDMKHKELRDVNLYSYTRGFNNLYFKLMRSVQAGDWNSFENALRLERERLLSILEDLYRDFNNTFEKKKDHEVSPFVLKLFESGNYFETVIESLGLDERTTLELVEMSRHMNYIKNLLKHLESLTGENSPWKKFLTALAVSPREKEIQRRQRLKNFIWSEVFPKAVEIANRIFDEHEGLSRGQEFFYSQKMGQSWYPPKVYKSLKKTPGSIEECPMYNDMRGALSKASESMSFSAFNALMTEDMKDLIRNERDQEYFEKEFFPLIAALKALNIHDELFNSEAGTTRKFEFSTTIDGDEHRTVISGMDGNVYAVCFDFDHFQAVDQQLRKLNLLASDDNLFFRIHETLDSLIKEKISLWMDSKGKMEEFEMTLERICREAVEELPYQVKVNLNPGKTDQALMIYSGTSVLNASVFEVKDYLEQLERNIPPQRQKDSAFLSRLKGYREEIAGIFENLARAPTPSLEIPLGDFLAQLTLKRGELPRLARGVWGSVGVSGALARIDIKEKAGEEVDAIRSTVDQLDSLVPLLKGRAARFVVSGSREADLLREQYEQNEQAKKQRFEMYHSAGPLVITEVFSSMNHFPKGEKEEKLRIISDTLSYVRTQYTSEDIFFNEVTLDAAVEEIKKVGGEGVAGEIEMNRRNRTLESKIFRVIARIENREFSQTQEALIKEAA